MYIVLSLHIRTNIRPILTGTMTTAAAHSITIVTVPKAEEYNTLPMRRRARDAHWRSLCDMVASIKMNLIGIVHLRIGKRKATVRKSTG